MRKTLPVTYPPITTLSGYAVPLSILYCHKESYDWIFSHYINIITFDIVERNNLKKDAANAFFIDCDIRRIAHEASLYNLVYRSRFPFLQVTEIAHDLLEETGINFTSFIKNAIDTDRYCYTWVDVSKINLYRRPEKFIHGAFIHGYDDEEKALHFADFQFNGGKYTFATCPYDEFEAAFASANASASSDLETGDNVIVMMKFWDRNENPGAHYLLDMDYMRESVREYLFPDPEVSRKFDGYIESMYTQKLKTYIGTEVYGQLQSAFNLGRDWIDQRLYHGLYDHKEMMLKRFDYLCEKGHLSDKKAPYFKEYEAIRDQALTIRNKVLKVNTSGITKQLESIPVQLNAIREHETELLTKIFLE